jgi:hypothetical protein
MAEIVEFKFNVAETHNGEKYFFLCVLSDMSGRYVRESDYAALLERHKRLVLRAGCALPWVESVTEYHELEAALAEEVDDT